MKLQKYWEAHFLTLECIASVVLAVTFFIWSDLVDGNKTLTTLLDSNRKEIYGALATIFGSLLGFIITAVSIIIGYSSTERLSPLTESKHYADLWKTFISTIKGLAIATILSLAGLIFDKDSQPFWPILYLNFWMTTFVIFRLGRSIWIFESILKILIKKKS